MPVPYPPPNVGAYTRTPSHQLWIVRSFVLTLFIFKAPNWKISFFLNTDNFNFSDWLYLWSVTTVIELAGGAWNIFGRGPADDV